MCERGFKRLQECWECYSDKLTEPGVYQPLLSIMVKLRRGAKPQFKVEHTSVSVSLFFPGLPCILDFLMSLYDQIHFGLFRLRWMNLKSA